MTNATMKTEEGGIVDEVEAEGSDSDHISIVDVIHLLEQKRTTGTAKCPPSSAAAGGGGGIGAPLEMQSQERQLLNTKEDNNVVIKTEELANNRGNAIVATSADGNEKARAYLPYLADQSERTDNGVIEVAIGTLRDDAGGKEKARDYLPYLADQSDRTDNGVKDGGGKRVTDNQEGDEGGTAVVKTSLARSPLGQNRPQALPGAHAASPVGGGGGSRNEEEESASSSSAGLEEGASEPQQEQQQHLAEARPVHEEDDLETAQQARPVDTSGTGGTTSSSLKDVVYKVGLPVGLLVFIVGLVILIVTLNAESNHSDDELSSDLPPARDADLPLPGMVLSLLPQYTVATIQQEPDSPQSMAYQWILNDPNLSNYTSDRIIQRFALSTLYYSTGGNSSWVLSTSDHQGGWLSYDTHECTWPMSQDVFELYWGFRFYSPCLLDGTNATDHDGPPGEVYQYLNLDSSSMDGELPEELYLLTNLRHVHLPINNGLMGTLSTRVGQLTNLNYLALSATRMSGTVPAQLFSITGLQGVYLYNCQFKGSIPSQVGLATSLVEIDLGSQPMTSTIPSEFGNLHENLEVLFAEHQALDGTLPSELGRLTALKELGIAGNQLSGSLPSELGLLARMHHLNAYGNRFDSSIPIEFGHLVSLIHFDLSSNALSGAIPTQLGRLAAKPSNPDFDAFHFDPPREAGKLIHLMLQENRLAGSLPSQLGLLTYLEVLDLHHNSLSFAIPSQLGLLTTLTNLNLTGNALTGKFQDPMCAYVDFDCSSDLCGCNCTCSLQS